MATMPTMWIGMCTVRYPDGVGSWATSDASIATPRSWSHGRQAAWKPERGLLAL